MAAMFSVFAGDGVYRRSCATSDVPSVFIGSISFSAVSFIGANEKIVQGFCVPEARRWAIGLNRISALPRGSSEPKK